MGMNMTGLTVYESVPVEEQVTKFVQCRKPTNTVDATFIRGQVPASIGKEASSMWPADIEVQVPENWSEGEGASAGSARPRSLRAPRGLQARHQAAVPLEASCRLARRGAEGPEGGNVHDFR